MRMSLWVLPAALASVMVLASGSVVQAQRPAVFISNVTSAITVPNNVNIGWAFTVNSPLSVTSLGVFDSGQDGLTNAYQVGIFSNVGGTLLAATTVLAGTADPLTNQFRYANLTTPLGLRPGQAYVIGMLDLAHSTDDQVENATGFFTDPNVNYVEPRALQNNAFRDPTVVQGALSPGLFGPNFQSVLALPEPGGAVLLLGLAGAIFLSRKRKVPAH